MTEDVVFVTFDGPCIVNHGNRARNLPHQFQGRVLYFNGESQPMYDLTVRDRVYALSHEPDDGDMRRIRVYYGVGYIAALRPAMQRMLYYPEHRARNTGERFLIYTVSNCRIHYRDKAFMALSQLGRGPAYYGGRCNGNLDKLDDDSIIRPMYDNRLKGQAWRDNAQLFHNYRFALVLENRKFDGYITEKIFNAFLSGSIPIYYGTEEVFDLFNADAFVYYDPDCPDEALERVKYLEQNQTAYKEVLGQPILAHGDATIKKYFSYTEQFGNGLMKRRIRKMMQFDDSPSVL